MVSILISFNYFSTNICFHLHIYIFVKLGLILSDSFVAFFSLYNLHLHFNGCMIHLNVVSQMLTDGLVVLSFLTNMGIISCFRKRGHLGHLKLENIRDAKAGVDTNITLRKLLHSGHTGKQTNTEILG